MRVAECFGEFQASRKRGSDLLLVALRKHQRYAERSLQFHLATGTG